jgi:hypothetical protein
MQRSRSVLNWLVHRKVHRFEEAISLLDLYIQHSAVSGANSCIKRDSKLWNNPGDMDRPQVIRDVLNNEGDEACFKAAQDFDELRSIDANDYMISSTVDPHCWSYLCAMGHRLL